MSLPPPFYDPFIPTGEQAQKRSVGLQPAMQAGQWYPVIEPPRVFGEPISTMPEYLWLLVGGKPAHVSAHLLEVRATVQGRLL